MSQRQDAGVEIVEVAPRDGFQSIAEPLPTALKLDLIRALAEAGCPRIEAGSFVSPRAVPQMADMAEIAAALPVSGGTRFSVLVPNRKGVDLALASGLREIVYVFSASEAHNRNNVGRGVAASVADLEALVAYLREQADAWTLRVDIATAFDCPFDGAMPRQRVVELAQQVQGLAPEAEIALCDTTGRANPRQVRDTFAAAMAACTAAPTRWAFHGHDTFGMGVANALFAHDAGVRVFDAAAAGLGGCPFAPGATGNTATEDLVFAFEEGGVTTGIDMTRLLAAADRIAELPGASVASHLRHVPRERAIIEGAVAAH